MISTTIPPNCVYDSSAARVACVKAFWLASTTAWASAISLSTFCLLTSLIVLSFLTDFKCDLAFSSVTSAAFLMSNLASTSCLAFSAFSFNFSIFPFKSSAISWNFSDSGRLASFSSISLIFASTSGSIVLFTGLSCEDAVDVPSSPSWGRLAKTSSTDSPASKALLISFFCDSISAFILLISLSFSSYSSKFTSFLIILFRLYINYIPP